MCVFSVCVCVPAPGVLFCVCFLFFWCWGARGGVCVQKKKTTDFFFLTNLSPKSFVGVCCFCIVWCYIGNQNHREFLRQKGGCRAEKGEAHQKRDRHIKQPPSPPPPLCPCSRPARRARPLVLVRVLVGGVVLRHGVGRLRKHRVVLAARFDPRGRFLERLLARGGGGGGGFGVAGVGRQGGQEGGGGQQGGEGAEVEREGGCLVESTTGVCAPSPVSRPHPQPPCRAQQKSV